MTRRHAQLGLAMVLVAAFLVHAGALGNGFAGDDRRIVQATLDDGRTALHLIGGRRDEVALAQSIEEAQEFCHVSRADYSGVLPRIPT